MRILLDECVDWRLLRDLTAHEVQTVKQLGWEKIKNGALFRSQRSSSMPSSPSIRICAISRTRLGSISRSSFCRHELLACPIYARYCPLFTKHSKRRAEGSFRF